MTEHSVRKTEIVESVTQENVSRVGIVIPYADHESIDVILAGQTEPVLRLNIFNHANGTQTVDVVALDKQKLKVMSWDEGPLVLNQECTSGLVAVIRDRR